jgi:seryl-tRNA synthetase
MSKHQQFNKEAAAKKMYMKPRPAKEIEQEYANTASNLGDVYFASELQKANIQKLTLRLSELKDEHVAAKAYESEQTATEKTAEPTTETTPAETT